MSWSISSATLFLGYVTRIVALRLWGSHPGRPSVCRSKTDTDMRFLREVSWEILSSLPHAQRTISGRRDAPPRFYGRSFHSEPILALASPTIDHVVADIPRAENQNRTGLRRRRLDLGGAVSCIPPFVCI